MSPAEHSPPKDALRRHIRVGKADMTDFYAIVESYEGLTTIRTVDVDNNIVQLDVAPDMLEIFDRLLEVLSQEMDIAEASAPASASR